MPVSPTYPDVYIGELPREVRTITGCSRRDGDTISTDFLRAPGA